MTHDDLRALRRFDTGKTLAQHIAELGITLPAGRLEPTIPLHGIEAYFELHIEQAPLLENLGRPLGLGRRSAATSVIHSPNAWASMRIPARCRGASVTMR